MSPRTQEQFKHLREQKRTYIMEAALEVFASEGFQHASISKIAQKAGISKGLMYNYFESKEDLIRSLLIQGLDHFLVFFDPNKDGILTEDEFEYFVEESFKLIQSNTEFWTLYFTVIFQPRVVPMIQEELATLSKTYFTKVKQYFSGKGIQDTLAETRFLMAVLDGVALSYLTDPENFPLEAAKKRILQLFK